MNDRELLELAAKAAGIEGRYVGSANAIHVNTAPLRNYVLWSPLEDDGDVFRLVVKLNLEVTTYFYFDEKFQRPATAKFSGGGKIKDLIASFPTYKESFKEYDPHYATRRAIVRAAAEIGRAME